MAGNCVKAARAGYSSRARYPSDVPRVQNGLRLTEHPNSIKRKELFSNLKAWIPIVHKYAKENPVGPIFFGPTSPFPYNQEFKNTVPISDNMKNLIFGTYKESPLYWTVRRLSRAFCLSIERIEAILRMKMLQDEMVARNFEIDKEYVARMEMAVGVNVNDYLPFSQRLSSSGSQIDIKEGEIFSYRIDSILKKPNQWLKPTFVKIHESKELTPEQAGAILEYDVVVARDYLSTRPLVKPDKDVPQSQKLIRNDPCERSRVPFLIVDIGHCQNPRDRLMLVRDINGDLREASDTERLSEAKRIWNTDAPKMMQPKQPYDPSQPRPFPKICIPRAFFKSFTLRKPRYLREENACREASQPMPSPHADVETTPELADLTRS